ncbi:hypothetical protein JHW43_006834 [Diplocarpon mali]|nr:hypothetical protein JHW43_006834 [Diplocarpon mali]
MRIAFLPAQSRAEQSRASKLHPSALSNGARVIIVLLRVRRRASRRSRDTSSSDGQPTDMRERQASSAAAIHFGSPHESDTTTVDDISPPYLADEYLYSDNNNRNKLLPATLDGRSR